MYKVQEQWWKIVLWARNRDESLPLMSSVHSENLLRHPSSSLREPFRGAGSWASIPHTCGSRDPPSPLRSSFCIWPTQPLPYRKYCFLGLLPQLWAQDLPWWELHTTVPFFIPWFFPKTSLPLPLGNFSKALSFSPTSTWHLLQAIECWSSNWRLGNPLTPDDPAFYPPQSPEAMITKPGLWYERQGRKIYRDTDGKKYTIYKLR